MRVFGCSVEFILYSTQFCFGIRVVELLCHTNHPLSEMADGVSQVRLRLPQQVTAAQYFCTDYAPSLSKAYYSSRHCYYGLLSHGFTGHFLPVGRERFLTSPFGVPPWFLCPLRLRLCFFQL